MCNRCETLRRHIAATRALSTELTDPTSIVLNRADLRALDETLMRAISEHRQVARA